MAICRSLASLFRHIFAEFCVGRNVRRLERAEAVAMDDLAREQIGDRGEPDVRVRAHVDALAEQELRGPHLVEEDERPDHLAARRGQGPAHLEAAEIARPGQDHRLDRPSVIAPRVDRRLPAHRSPSRSWVLTARMVQPAGRQGGCRYAASGTRGRSRSRGGRAAGRVAHVRNAISSASPINDATCAASVLPERSAAAG
jgi:hypothetical protein